MKALRQDVLEEAPQELSAQQPLGTPRVGAAVFPAEGDWVWSMPRMRALLIAVRKTSRDR
jgi:hypothetical protein